MVFAFTKGLLFGMGLMLAMGPVFFTIIQTSLQRGFRTAILVATGVILSDTFYVALASFGLSQFLDSEEFKLSLAIGGGAIMFGYGLVLFFRKTESRGFTDVSWNGNALKYLVKGWLINFLNPFVFVFWIGVAGLAHVDYGSVHLDKIAFFSGIIAMVYTSDILKSYLANQLRSVVTTSLISKFNKALGIFLIASGIWLFSFALEMRTLVSFASLSTGPFWF